MEYRYELYMYNTFKKREKKPMNVGQNKVGNETQKNKGER